MLFRNKNGEIISICKSSFISDKLYYKHILNNVPNANGIASANAGANANANANGIASATSQMESMIDTITKCLQATKK
jgi:hypothetical protein